MSSFLDRLRDALAPWAIGHPVRPPAASRQTDPDPWAGLPATTKAAAAGAVPPPDAGPWDGFPATSTPAAAAPPDPSRPRVFDPAVKQYLKAFRLGDPAFADPEVARRWRAARSDVMGHLLRVVSGSPWRGHLVLRGSLLLKAWLGDAAREPGDMDWVVTPESVTVRDRLAREILEGLPQLVRENPVAGTAAVEGAGIAADDIWTYDRAPGKRLAFPWRADGLPPGAVQMDFVFEEELWAPPEVTEIPTSRGPVEVMAASKELALAWKLLWLHTDVYPQGKDLYDATLLAENCRLPLRLLGKALGVGEAPPPDRPDRRFPLRWDVDWDNFRLECPWVAGSAREWQQRLAATLAPMFSVDADR